MPANADGLQSLLQDDPQPGSYSTTITTATTSPATEPTPLTTQEPAQGTMFEHVHWIPLAIASGGCAAFNGVFAKLTTTALTTSFATAVSNALFGGKAEAGVEVVLRGFFFVLNLVFNGIVTPPLSPQAPSPKPPAPGTQLILDLSKMWTLFTLALTRATSTTRVSIINTSANFVATAVLGWCIFGERLPGLWWVGAGLLVVGNVVIGRRDEEGPPTLKSASPGDVEGRGAGRGGVGSGEEGEALLLDDELELELEDKDGNEERRAGGVLDAEVDDPLR
ncbi:MAG: hypothetical protein M1832_003585 [Thelocarpon impressellum]|nr:MAG: hypothetical protein M1832_003585 [Thelocarpon impressellum]